MIIFSKGFIYIMAHRGLFSTNKFVGFARGVAARRVLELNAIWPFDNKVRRKEAVRDLKRIKVEVRPMLTWGGAEPMDCSE